MRILITGITGLAGSHLADYLLTEDPAPGTAVRIGTDSEGLIFDMS